jgi:hypothetical protein
MCHHRRLIYAGCNHSLWGDLVRPCEDELAFQRGEQDVGCTLMLSHGIHARRVEGLCKPCRERKTATDAKFVSVRDRIRDLRDGLAKTYGELASEMKSEHGVDVKIDDDDEKNETMSEVGDS